MSSGEDNSGVAFESNDPLENFFKLGLAVALCVLLFGAAIQTNTIFFVGVAVGLIVLLISAIWLICRGIVCGLDALYRMNHPTDKT